MSVFDQIKNFIRHGRNPLSLGTNDSLSSHGDKQYEAVARFVQEENMAKKKLPEYEGLEQYTLIDKLGDGAFSNVYKAIDNATDELVAVKVVRKYELKPQQRASVLKEVQIMRTIKHPNIVQLKAFKETKGHYFLVLELCEGGELFHQVVRLTYFSEDLTRHCIRQVADAIRYLHEERGVVHRDIKPENLLFEPIPFRERTSTPPALLPGDDEKEDEGEFVLGVGGGGIGCVKIADFGLSKVVWDEQTMTPCGTVGYTAPEIVKDERYSKSVDMWALGCVLYTLLCGFPPFYDESIQVLTEKVARGQFTFLSPWWDPISDQAKDLIRHLLCVDPEERYTITQFMQHPWITQANASCQSAAEMMKPAAAIPIQIERQAHQLALDSPTRGRRDIFSGLTSMKEVFDVSYAVHRMAEERTHYKDYRRHGRFDQGPHAFARNPILENVSDDDDEEDDDEEEEEEDDVYDDDDNKKNTPHNHGGDPVEKPKDSSTEQAPPSLAMQELPRGVEKIRAALTAATVGQDTPSKMLYQMQRDRVGQNYKLQEKRSESMVAANEADPRAKTSRRSNRHAFELNLENATLIGRRKHNHNQH